MVKNWRNLKQTHNWAVDMVTMHIFKARAKELPIKHVVLSPLAFRLYRHWLVRTLERAGEEERAQMVREGKAIMEFDSVEIKQGVLARPDVRVELWPLEEFKEHGIFNE